MKEPRPPARRALSHVGGAVTLRGDPDLGIALRHALEVPTSLEAEDVARAHVHGFHSYPARMHPVTARRLVDALSRQGEHVLDPFCGSGTVLVEARLAGREATGVDANPLAVRLSALKVRGVGEADRARLVECAHAVAAEATTRRKARAGASRRYGADDVALFDPHVLLELDGLRVGLDRLDDVRAREDLELVLSSILVKVSRRAGDSVERVEQKRIAAGYPSRLFEKKTDELARRLAEVAPTLLAAPPAIVRLGDARRPPGPAGRHVSLVVTSPPYPGNFDYLAHHAARLRWLRLDSGPLERAEIGARRHLDPLGAEPARLRFEQDMVASLAAAERALTPRGRIALLMADSVVAGGAVHALDLVRHAATRAGLTLLASASQPRPHFHAPTQRAFTGRPRAEHLILLGRKPA